MGRKIKTLIVPLTAVAIAVSSGCSVDFYARRMVRHSTTKGKSSLWWLGSPDKLIAKGKISSHHRIPTTDGTVLDVWVIQARGDCETQEPPRGTVLILHGIIDSKARFFSMGRQMARMGYNVVMLDHRRHGRSEGTYTTFGAKEKYDTREVIDSLLKSGEIAEPIYVFGQSMGAAIAVQYAAIDPAACRAVMAVAPYTDMRSAARRFVPFMTAEKFEQVVIRSGELADFDPDDASTVLAAAKLTAPLLVVHGRIDAIVPHAHGVAVYEAANVRKKLVTFPLLGHISMVLGRQTWFAEQADKHFRSAGSH